MAARSPVSTKRDHAPATIPPIATAVRQFRAVTADPTARSSTVGVASFDRPAPAAK
jgi:hypothetical protein